MSNHPTYQQRTWVPPKRPIGPEMEFCGILEGQAVRRKGHLWGAWAQGVALILASDGPQHWPPHFFVKQWDLLRYGRWLCTAWNANRPVPRAFKLQTHLPKDLIQQALELKADEWGIFLDFLRERGILPPLPSLTRKSLPPGIAWDELTRLYLKQENDPEPKAR